MDPRDARHARGEEATAAGRRTRRRPDVAGHSRHDHLRSARHSVAVARANGAPEPSSRPVHPALDGPAGLRDRCPKRERDRPGVAAARGRRPRSRQRRRAGRLLHGGRDREEPGARVDLPHPSDADLPRCRLLLGVRLGGCGRDHPAHHAGAHQLHAGRPRSGHASVDRRGVRYRRCRSSGSDARGIKRAGRVARSVLHRETACASPLPTTKLRWQPGNAARRSSPDRDAVRASHPRSAHRGRPGTTARPSAASIVSSEASRRLSRLPSRSFAETDLRCSCVDPWWTADAERASRWERCLSRTEESHAHRRRHPPNRGFRKRPSAAVQEVLAARDRDDRRDDARHVRSRHDVPGDPRCGVRDRLRRCVARAHRTRCVRDDVQHDAADGGVDALPRSRVGALW